MHLFTTSHFIKTNSATVYFHTFLFLIFWQARGDNEKPYKNTIDSYIAYKNRYKKNFTSAPLWNPKLAVDMITWAQNTSNI